MSIFGRLPDCCLAALLTVACFAPSAAAQAPATPAAPPAPPLPYGASIDLATAQKILAAAKVEADNNKWPVAIAVVDTAGYLVAFHRLDNTQLGSVDVALGKAKTAVLFRRPTKAFQDVMAQGGAGLRILALPGATPVEGGLPIVVDGKIIGGIGVSGVQSSEDAQIAGAGIAALSAQ